jgi:hypothetical protein
MFKVRFKSFKPFKPPDRVRGQFKSLKKQKRGTFDFG